MEEERPRVRKSSIRSAGTRGVKKSKSDGKYFKINIPDWVEDLKTLNEEGDIKELGKEDYLYPEIDSQTLSNGEKVHFIKYETVGDKDAGSVKLRREGPSENPYTLTIPNQYVGEDEDNKSPFKGCKHGDEINVEVDLKTNQIRLYQITDYPRRVDELGEGRSPYYKGTTLIPATHLSLSRKQHGSKKVPPNSESSTFELIPFKVSSQDLLQFINNHPEHIKQPNNRRYVDLSLIPQYRKRTQLETGFETKLSINDESGDGLEEDNYLAESTTSYKVQLPNDRRFHLKINSEFGTGAVRVWGEDSRTEPSGYKIMMSSGPQNGEFVLSQRSKHQLFIPIPRRREEDNVVWSGYQRIPTE